MHLGGVSLMLGEAIDGILFVQLEHEAVTCDLGYDRGCCNREAEGIAFDDGALWQGNVREVQCIQQECLGGDRELGKSITHGLFGGLQDVASIDEFDGTKANTYCQSMLHDDLI